MLGAGIVQTMFALKRYQLLASKYAISLIKEIINKFVRLFAAKWI